ncbi:MAG: ATP-binding cassette domain-containing protein [Treponema sp.]|nr:ATP-binding cassette domain-containing protein [Treponema sp.]
MKNSLISIKNCAVSDSKKTFIKNVNWELKNGDFWLVFGENGGGKAEFLRALCGIGPEKFVLNCEDNSEYFNDFLDSCDCEIVSLEQAAKLIEEERLNDESEFVDGGVDIGRTGRFYIAQKIYETENKKLLKNEPLPAKMQNLENDGVVKLCGISKILDRGLKYMSTGEIRRTMLAAALLSKKKFLVLSNPFAGLDVESRKILFDFVCGIGSTGSSLGSTGFRGPIVVLCMDRWHEIPESITHVIEFSNKEVSFCGKKQDFLLFKNFEKADETDNLVDFSMQFSETLEDSSVCVKDDDLDSGNLQNQSDSKESEEILFELKNVNVGWDGKLVLKNLSWKLKKGEHWLIQGPNGCGKTTLLELITGDNKQVYCNDVTIFGIKRGSGESIWDIKKHLGIVSYRLHVEYRMVGNTSIQNVIISGFKDSIGLYETPTDVEIQIAKKWLSLAGFEGRELESFGSLSYGEQRAILILRSVVKSPKILILDEPCHGLDENYRKKILNLMELIAEKGKTTMLHVTHDITEILSCEKHTLQFVPEEDPMYKIERR